MMTEKSLNLMEFDDDEEAPISFTTEATEALKDAILSEKLEPGMGVRVGVRGGGCDVTVYLDPMSAMHLEGTTIDYVTSLMGMGFKFINPNAKKTCGCGSSFG